MVGTVKFEARIKELVENLRGGSVSRYLHFSGCPQN
jgi:hypothetical protein